LLNNMAFIRATYDGSTVTSVDDSSTLAANYTKYWTNEHGVEDSPGVWCTTANKYIPDEWYDEETGCLWPGLTMNWSEYNGGD